MVHFFFLVGNLFILCTVIVRLTQFAAIFIAWLVSCVIRSVYSLLFRWTMPPTLNLSNLQLLMTWPKYLTIVSAIVVGGLFFIWERWGINNLVIFSNQKTLSIRRQKYISEPSILFMPVFLISDIQIRTGI